MKKPTEQYFRFHRSLLSSPSWSALNIHEMRAFFRIMEEHQSKSGFVHDGLVVTKRDFLASGIQPQYIAPATRVLCALGIMECTRNMGGSQRGRTPNMWKPTFLPSTPTLNDAAHTYLNVKTKKKEAEAIAHRLRFHRTEKDGPPKRVKPRLKVTSSPSTAPREVASYE